jgi:uncharacterized protein (TIGR00730 family)
MPKICVFGSYKNFNKKKKNEIIMLGSLLGKNGFDVISGGFGGTMEDISKGAKDAGGKTIGVTYYKWKDVSYKKPNKYIDEEIKTKDIFERIDVMMKNADAFIVLPGGTGTLLELAACLEHINKGLSEPKPIIALGNFWRPITKILSKEKPLSGIFKYSLKPKTCADLVTFLNTPNEIISKLKSELH